MYSGENDTIVNEILSESKTLEKAKYQAKQEVLLYLIATEECMYPKPEIDPLEWWRENKHIYPNVAKCARMWLSAPVTSTPSERVFLICGMVDPQK